MSDATARNIGNAIGFVIRWSVIWSYRGTKLLARLIAQLALLVLPPPTTSGQYSMHACAVGGGVALVVALLGLVSMDLTVFSLVGAYGLALGGTVGWVIVDHGKAAVAAADGDLAIGHGRGALGVAKPHTLARADRVRHVAVYGATGSGKSTVLRNLAYQDATAPDRLGFLCVDIKDSLVTEIAANIPPERLDDVLLFDPADTAFPPAFNPLADVDPAQRTLAAAELVAALKRLYDDSWGPRLEHVLRMVVLTLLETPEATLLDINRLLTDTQYRSWALPHVTNLAVQEFWTNEFPAIAGKGSTANVASILNKLSVLVIDHNPVRGVQVIGPFLGCFHAGGIGPQRMYRPVRDAPARTLAVLTLVAQPRHDGPHLAQPWFGVDLRQAGPGAIAVQRQGPHGVTAFNHLPQRSGIKRGNGCSRDGGG